MAKYSEHFKLHIVKEYLDGHLSYDRLAKKYRIPSSTPLKQWVRSYKNDKKEGLRRKRKKDVYSVQFKLDVLHFIKRTGASYQDTSILFELSNPSLIASWNKRYQEKGIEGLGPKPRRRPSMSKSKKNKSKEQESSREEKLERENELLRLENAYLKKRRAFKENPNAYLEKHKPSSHSNSKKNDSN